VKIQLIVRGVCALRPGVPGVSDNISVRSIVGRFLEHSRVYWFENGGRQQLLLSSADWMERNFFRRIEVAFPLSLARLRTRVREDLETYLGDTVNAWLLQADGSYVRAVAEGMPVDSQAALLNRYGNALRPPA
jgi:polyphosphate kinase